MHWEDPEGWDAEGGRRGDRDGEHVNPWLIHVNVWQKPLQYCKVISLQLIKINEKKSDLAKKKTLGFLSLSKKEGMRRIWASGIAFPPESEAQLQRLLVVGLGQVP